MALETLFEGETFFEHTPVRVLTDSSFFDIDPKNATRERVKRGIEEFVESFQSPSKYSPDKSKTPLDRLELFLYGLEQEGFDDEGSYAYIEPPKEHVPPPGRTGWTNTVIFSGYTGVYFFQLQNGYHMYS